MNSNLIGYSLKFQFEPDDTTLLNHYFRYYSIGEIKLNQETLESVYFDNILLYLKEHHPQKISFHLPNDIFSNDEAFLKYLPLIQCKFSNYIPSYYVAHYPPALNEDIIVKRIYSLLMCLPKGSYILLENDKNVSLNEFAVAFKICEHFGRNSSVGICFDIGHALFYCQNERKIISFLSDTQKEKFIHEWDLHNVLNERDHQAFDLVSCQGALLTHVLATPSKNQRYILELKKIDPFSKAGISQLNMIDPSRKQ